MTRFTKTVAELRKVLITSSRYKPEAHPLAQEVAAILEARSTEVLIDLEGTLPLVEAAQGADLIISVGGDGTLLATARRLVGVTVPTIGVNIGKLGFLAEHSPSDILAYVRGQPLPAWRLSPKMMLQVRLAANNEQAELRRYALNDLIVSQGVMTRLISITMAVDGLHATQYRADGVVISTPVGSTAYSLSLGGPILSQGLRAFVITPIAPHALTNRPIVIEGSSEVSFAVESPVGELALVVDGQERLALRQGDRFTVCTAPTDFVLVSSARHSYFDILRTKLGWGQAPNLRPDGGI
jgi:NAD+ kinase